MENELNNLNETKDENGQTDNKYYHMIISVLFLFFQCSRPRYNHNIYIY